MPTLALAGPCMTLQLLESFHSVVSEKGFEDILEGEWENLWQSVSRCPAS